MDREIKLPKWAQEELASLRRRLRDLEADREQLLGQGDPDHARGFYFTSGWGKSAQEFPAPLYGRSLEFRGSAGRLSLNPENLSDEIWLRVQGDIGSILVRPSSSNVVLIRGGKRGKGE